jgi:NTP pyrophosphatase (non-canonical NTP hydrolase)
MSRPFNKLSPAEAERLALLAEECGECIQAVGKILRHGFDSVHPEGRDEGRDNRSNLEREMGDVLAAINMSFAAGDTSAGNIYTRQAEKLEAVKQYLHHQGGRRRGKG